MQNGRIRGNLESIGPKDHPFSSPRACDLSITRWLQIGCLQDHTLLSCLAYHSRRDKTSRREKERWEFVLTKPMLNRWTRFILTNSLTISKKIVFGSRTRKHGIGVEEDGGEDQKERKGAAQEAPYQLQAFVAIMQSSCLTFHFYRC